jgi:hypothetical protein
MSLIILVEKFNLDNLWSTPGCHVVPKAFSISKNTATVGILLLKFKVTWSASLIHCRVVPWRAWKPNGLALSKCFSPMCFWIICEITNNKKIKKWNCLILTKWSYSSIACMRMQWWLWKRASLSASTFELISTLGDIKIEARLWNRFQSVNFSSGSEICLVITWSKIWNIIGKWSETRISDTMTSESLIFLCTSNQVHLHFPQGNKWLGILALKFQNHLWQTIATVSGLKGWKLYYSKTDV